MLLLSPFAGQLGQTIGARIPLTVGPIVAAVGLFMLSRRRRRRQLRARRAPRRDRVGRRHGDHRGTADGGGAGQRRRRDGGCGVGRQQRRRPLRERCWLWRPCPALAGIATGGSLADSIDSGYQTALQITAVSTAIGGVIAAFLVGRTAEVRPTAHPGIGHACNDAASSCTNHPVSDTRQGAGPCGV